MENEKSVRGTGAKKRAYNLICLHYTVFDCKITHMESKFSIDNECLADLFKLQPFWSH